MAEKYHHDNDKYGKKFTRAFEMIDSAKLSAIEGIALSLFIGSARAPVVASKYVQDRVSQNSETCTLKETLRSIQQDLVTLARKMTCDHYVNPQTEAALYERDGGRCFISGRTLDVKPTYIISPSIRDDDDLLPGGYLRPLLEAAISPEETEKMFTLLNAQEDGSDLKNLLLMEPSIRHTFRNGHFQIIKQPYLEPPYLKDPAKLANGGWWIRRTPPGRVFVPTLPENDKLYAVPSTKNPETHPLPAMVLLSVHGIVSRPLRILEAEKRIEAGWPAQKTEPWTLGKIGITCLRTALSLIPNFVRIKLYMFIDRLIEYWDPVLKGSHVKNLPLGLCLKKSDRNIKNEANALLAVEKFTTINAPRLIDSVMIDATSGFIIMTRIFGDRLDNVYFLTTWEERKKIGEDLAKWIAEMRQILNKSNYLIADTLGGPISDHRFSGESWGPFNTVSDFIDRLTRDVTKPRNEPPLSLLYERKYDVCFTHSDLHMSNLFVTRGRLSGIIDWENAGFKPEYWEFTRSLWPYGGERNLCYIYTCAFDGKYDDELEAEVFILHHSPFVF
ncbi:APH domain-containing protein [Trichophyton interdigitale]|uniref:APH domain-containing protein n=1 Tax=Trichophyton interdigitale TaxID=101480 RepID=A0A9P4YJV2_9EURO|nr:APH domain-containing protein [Trichophyton interdigitale]KAF3897781.1 APH domain-containing protein [Trichophyton interdigitale]